MKTLLSTILLIAFTISANAQEWTAKLYSGIPIEEKKIIFEDDFEKFNNYWLLGIEENSWIENLEKGNLFFQSLTNKPKQDILPVIFDYNRDFEIETKIKFEKGEMDKAYGFQWGKSQNPVKQFDFLLSANGQFTIDKYTGEFHDYVPFTQSKLVNSYASNKITIRKVEDTYYFFLNENLIHTMPFEPFFGNLLGFQVAENSTMLVDYIRVSYLGKEKKEIPKVLIMDYKFITSSEKATIGKPITLKLSLKNISNVLANNIELNFSFPENIEVLNSEILDKLDAQEEKNISVQFFANKNFTDSIVNIKLDIKGVPISNVNDINLTLKINHELPIEVDKVLAQNYSKYRGSSNPLKGLNVAKAMKDIQVGNYYALIIGIDSYTGVWNPLQNAVRDAKAIEKELKTNYKFSHFKTLFNEEATRANIIKEIEWLMSVATEKDNVFIYYSGHGDYNKNLNKGFWIPVNAHTSSMSNYISNSDLKGFLNGIKSKHTLLVADACFSGNLFRGKTMTIPYDNSTKYYNKVYSLVSREAISSGGLEPVMDGGKDGHSIFAYYFLKSLRNNSNKYYDASQLFNDIKIPVVNNSEQTPNFNPIKNTGDEGGQFIFIKK
ncbi:MAG: caspase family protein [Bacteroidetes bacterium]|nr:caspase family protein [Bacteroidota bacterium]